MNRSPCPQESPSSLLHAPATRPRIVPQPVSQCCRCEHGGVASHALRPTTRASSSSSPTPHAQISCDSTSGDGPACRWSVLCWHSGVQTMALARGEMYAVARLELRNLKREHVIHHFFACMWTNAGWARTCLPTSYVPASDAVLPHKHAHGAGDTAQQECSRAHRWLGNGRCSRVRCLRHTQIPRQDLGPGEDARGHLGEPYSIGRKVAPRRRGA